MKYTSTRPRNARQTSPHLARLVPLAALILLLCAPRPVWAEDAGAQAVQVADTPTAQDADALAVQDADVLTAQDTGVQAAQDADAPAVQDADVLTAQDTGVQAAQDADEQTFEVDSWPLLIMYLAQLPQDDGEYVFRLTHNLQSPQFHEGIVVAHRSIVIDLNGYNIVGNEDGSASSTHHFAIVNNGGTLTIQDTSEEGTSSITGFSAEQGGAILVEDGGDLRILGGRISGNNATQGGGIAVTGGSVSVTGGSFTSNSATQGGGIAVIGGTCDISGGSFSGNSAEHGGGIAVTGGTCSITDGSVTDNSCTSDGGGVVVTGGTCTVDGGNISGNSAVQGGGVAVLGGSVSATDGSISGNNATTGGGIAVTGGTCAISNGSTSSNSAEQGGGIAVTGGTISVTGGSVSGNSCSSDGAGVYVGTQGHFEISESPLIGRNMKHAADDVVQDIYLGTNAIITTSGELNYSDAIVVEVQDLPRCNKTRALATPGSYDSRAFACQTTEGYELHYETNADGQNTVFILCLYEPVYSWADLAHELRTMKKNEETTFKLTCDVEYGTGTPDEFAAYPLEIRKGAKVTIDLNGYRIDRMLSNQDTPSMEDSERCLYVSKGTLTIRDSRGGGKVTGGCCRHGGGVFIADGTLVLESGAITGNKATYGGGVYVGMGSFELKGGSVTGNIGLAEGIPSGGGVHVGDNSVVPPVMDLEDEDEEDPPVDKITQGSMSMTGGNIEGNKAAGWGAGVCASNGILTVTGGSIDRNGQLEGSDQGGGGIYAHGRSTVDLQSCSVSENQLTGNDGAGIGIADGSTATLGTATIARNKCIGGGGGGIMVRASQLSINGARICDNEAGLSGGGIMMRYNSACTMHSGSIEGNYSYNSGGGVEVNWGSVFTMNGGEVRGNHATVRFDPQAAATIGVQDQAEDDKSVLTDTPWGLGGGFCVTGTLRVSGGTITRNVAHDGGNGICLNRYLSDNARVVLSGSPLLADNYAQEDIAAREKMRYEDILINIIPGSKGDEQQVVEVEGTFTPLRPVCVAKAEDMTYGTYTEPLALTPLVGKGDYELDAFVTSQMHRDLFDHSPEKKYTIIKRDNGILYALMHAHSWSSEVPWSTHERMNIYCRGHEDCPYYTKPAFLEIKVRYQSDAGDEVPASDATKAIAHIERSNIPTGLAVDEKPVAYYKGNFWPYVDDPLDGPPSEPGTYVAVSSITVMGRPTGYIWTTITLKSQNDSDAFSDVEEDPQNATPQASQDNSSSQTPKQSGQSRTSTQHAAATPSSRATSHASQGATLPQTSDVPMGPVKALGILGAASLLGAHVIRRRKCA